MATINSIEGVMKSRSRSKLSVTKSQCLETDRVFFVDKRFVCPEVAADEEAQSRASVSVYLSSCQSEKPVEDLCHHPLCIYKRSEMAQRIVCLRYILKASFVLLIVFGLAVCGITSYFVHELGGSFTESEWYGPPVLLLITGIINFILGLYFFITFDIKYNRLQLYLFFILVVIVGVLKVIAGVWALIDQVWVNSAISKILEENLSSIGQIEGLKLASNITQIKFNCCGIENAKNDDVAKTEKELVWWSCCDVRNHESSKDTCSVLFEDTCRDISMHRYRSILVYTFIVALFSIIVQIVEFIALRTYSKRLLYIRRRQSVATSLADGATRAMCPSAQLGPQHVCEGCASPQAHR